MRQRIIAILFLIALVFTFFSTSRADKEGIPVLLYHHILEHDDNIHHGNPSVLTVKRFEDQMRYLYENGYKTLTLKELEQCLTDNRKIPDKCVVITFDDGYKNNYVYAYPILKKYGFKATVFLITSKIQDKTVPFDPEKTQFLNWEEVERSGDVFEFACHTHDLHKRSRFLIGGLITRNRKEIANDLRTSLNILNTRYLAYPFGQYSKKSIDVAKQLGFTMAFTTNNTHARPGDNMFMIGRHYIYSHTSFKQFKKMLQR